MNQNQQESNPGGTFDFRFTTINNKFLTTSHHILNGKLIQFLNRTRSLKQFIRVNRKKNKIIFFEILFFCYSCCI
jgi:hypothetical protein